MGAVNYWLLLFIFTLSACKEFYGQKLYVINRPIFELGSVTAINIPEDTYLTTVPVGMYPTFFVSNLQGTRLYVANNMDDTISVIDTETNTVINTISDAGSGYAIGQTLVLSQDGLRLYGCSRSGGLVIIDTQAENGIGIVIKKMNPSIQCGLLTLASIPFYGDKIYIKDLSSQIFVYDAVLDTITPIISPPNQVTALGGFAASPDGSRVYSFCYQNCSSISQACPCVGVIDTAIDSFITVLSDFPEISSNAYFEFIFVSADSYAVYIKDSLDGFYATIKNSNGVAMISSTLTDNGASFPVGTILKVNSKNNQIIFQLMLSSYTYASNLSITSDGKKGYAVLLSSISPPQSQIAVVTALDTDMPIQSKTISYDYDQAIFLGLIP